MLIERIREEHFTHTNGIGAIDNDDIEGGIRRFRHVSDTIANDHVRTGVIPCFPGDLWQMLLGQLDNRAVDLHHDSFFNGLVLKHTPKNATIARADDQHTPRVRVSE